MAPTQFSPAEVKVLESILEEFAAANAEDRKKILTKAYESAKEKRPQDDEYPLVEAQYREVIIALPFPHAPETDACLAPEC